MSKPDDIPQSVWDATENVRISYAMPDPNEVREVVARAIMAATLAEREACMSAEPAPLDLPRGTYGLAAIEAYWAGAKNAREAYAAAIRKRGEA